MQINVWAVQTHRPVALGDQQQRFHRSLPGRQCAARPGEGRPASAFSDMPTHGNDVRLWGRPEVAYVIGQTDADDPGCVKTPCCWYDSLVILREESMRRFVEEADRGQWTLLPECLDDFIDESNPVRVIDVFVDALDLAEMSFEGWSRRRLVGHRTTPRFSLSFTFMAI
jgi:hypothetical protein